MRRLFAALAVTAAAVLGGTADASASTKVERDGVTADTVEFDQRAAPSPYVLGSAMVLIGGAGAVVLFRPRPHDRQPTP